ncbi:hypothetical protein [Ornithinimicrobium sp. CNJ-824]|uniref:hypothetical protein n=1 Tax=Ornithinimicrobium sp. CNJ-824 TaxID=1904966 RepID=UPI003159846A
MVLPGAAGTVQEIFQAATRLYYEVDGDGRPLPPLVLVDRQHWTAHLPVHQLLRALGRDRTMGRAVHLVDTVDEAVGVVVDATAVSR